MPGTFATVYIVAFDLDGQDQAVQAFASRVATGEDAAVEQARELEGRHAGVLVWKRDLGSLLARSPIHLSGIGPAVGFDFRIS